MTALLDLRQAIEAFAASADDGDLWDRYAWVYADDGEHALHARFHLSAAADEEDHLQDEAGEGLPAFAAGHGLRHYLAAADFADVLLAQKRQRPASQPADYAEALDHYHRHETLLDHGGLDAGAAPPPVPGLARGLHAEYDLDLEACPPGRLDELAQTVAALRGIGLAQARAGCGALPLRLGERLDGAAAARLERRLAALSTRLRRTAHRALPWQPSPG
jgi:hypothetical protein